MDKTITGARRRWFNAALDQPPGEREGWLLRHCDDKPMRQQVLALLAAYADESTGLLDLPVAAVIERWQHDQEPSAPEALIGTRIGAFRLLRTLGQGGMATVYLAEREDVDFQQRVAVKLLRRGLYSELEQQLFVRERRTLATLSHPDIARLIDGGVTDAGIPYLVMDFVDGVPITRYAAEHGLRLRARLDLFHRVCRAVDAAHRQLVVHRDIKPSNILVTAACEVKLLDFGIAKLLDAKSKDDPGEEAISAMTPGYAAPEQYRGGPISTATDVYALGVLLHELLLGERPGVAPNSLPSLRASESDSTSTNLPAPRRALRSALRGDLDCLLLKALDAEPERRYSSAGALADDIQRHLRHEPIAARTPTTAYKMQKFAQRHRGGVSVAAILTLAVLASLTAALWQTRIARAEAMRAQAQTQVARQEAQRANAVRDLLVELFENENPGGALSSIPDTATLLKRGAERAQSDLAGTPALQVDMLVTVARVYDQMSQYAEARPLLAKALVIARRLPAGSHDTLIDALAQAGQLELSEKKYAKALPLLDEALLLQRSHHPRGLTTAALLHQRALLYSETDRHAEAIDDYLASLSMRRKRLGPHHPLLIKSYGALGTAYLRAHRHAEAIPWLRRALSLSRQLYGEVHEETARRLSNLGATLHALGHMQEAEEVLLQTVAIDGQVYATPNISMASHLHNLGVTHYALGRLDEAETSLRKAIGIERLLNRKDTPGVAFSTLTLARVQLLRGDLPGALALALEGQRILAATLPASHSRRLDAELFVARMRLLQSKSPDLRAYTTDLAGRIEAQDYRDPDMVATATYLRGLAHARLGDDAAALALIEQSIRLVNSLPGHRHDPLSWFVTLAEVREKTGDHAGASRALVDGIAFADKRQMSAAHPSRTPLIRMLAAQNSVLRK